jgi:hypothetical protein
MKKKSWSFLVFIVLFAACSSSETYLDSSQSSSNVLRGLVFNSAGKVDLPLPVSIYVFNSSGQCADMQTLQTENEAFSFTLAPGSYTLSVISGASAEKYLLPDDVDEATPDFLLQLKSPEDTHAELAAKTTSITLGNNAVTDFTIIVDRVISQITASINDVPDDVTSVSISLQPLEEQLLLNGSYGGDGKGETTFALEKESGGLWKTPIPVFVLPGSDDVSVIITFTNTNGSRSYSYATAIPVEANCKTEITATYKAGSAEISGSIQCRDWKEEHQITIEFGEGSSDGNKEKLTQGDMYKGCYILDVLQESSEQSTFVLIGPKAFSEVPIETAVTASGRYEHEGLTGWRPPTVGEAEILYAICSRELEELNKLLFTGIVPDGQYLCMDSDQKFYYSTMDTPEFTLSPAKEKTMYRMRFISEVTVKWESESEE